MGGASGDDDGLERYVDELTSRGCPREAVSRPFMTAIYPEFRIEAARGEHTMRL